VDAAQPVASRGDAPPPASQRCLDITADLKAEVSVDGVSYGALPRRALLVEAGPHQVVVSPSRGHRKPQTQGLVIEPGPGDTCIPVQFTFHRKKSSDR
jgi:hypothetical protein